MAMTSAAPLVWINGFPGCGKLTIASHLERLYDNLILIDNHKLKDPVAAKFPRGHPDYQEERKLCRERVLREVVENPEKLSQMVIFTDCQTNDDLGRIVATEYEIAAQQAGRPFKPVHLTCDVEENIRRIATDGRINSATTKLTDPVVLKEIRETCEMFRFEGYDDLMLDTSDEESRRTAEKLLRYIENAN